ncbi:MAG: hypothetical protein JXQ27_18260, partial [Acidobacteria bacterium]|nr:hypothetical protein [Acidobacteriota bacterium]
AACSGNETTTTRSPPGLTRRKRGLKASQGCRQKNGPAGTRPVVACERRPCLPDEVGTPGSSSFAP